MQPDLSTTESRYFASAKTDATGKGVLTFDELKDDTEYQIYITAGNNIPYMPKKLLGDDEIMGINVKTNKNPNVGTEADVIRTYRAT